MEGKQGLARQDAIFHLCFLCLLRAYDYKVKVSLGSSLFLENESSVPAGSP
jgi:hypothetical protein